MTFWDVFEDMRSMHEEMDRALGSVYGRTILPASKGTRSRSPARIPVTDLKETEKDVAATLEIPGVNKDDIELNVTENSLEVRAEQKHEREEKGKDFASYTSVSRGFYRKLPLPSHVVPEKSTAEYKDGVLKVVMPKAESGEKKKKLEIR